MTRARIALLLGIAAAMVGGGSGRAAAQDMEFGVDEAEGTGEAGAEGTGEAGAEGTGEAGAEGAEGGDVIGDLAQPEQGAQQQQGERAPRRTEAIEEIYAVQQVYALRNGRVEIAPSVSQTLNDPYVTHPGAGLGINYWWTNVLAVGINFIWYQGLENESDLNFFVRRSTRLAVPITEYQLGAHLNFTYVPLYGKFAMFNEYIFQWDAYIVGGVGMMRTRPVPVVDPEIRQFDFDWRVAFNVGIGLRIFITRWLAVFAELRDYAYLERLENLQVALGEGRDDPGTWLAESASLTNNVTAHIGITLFFPFSFEYQLPR